MKLMKKILVSAMAISAIAAVGAVSTYAEAVTISPADSAFTVNYDAAAGTITLSDVTVANDQKTLLVLNADVDTFDDTTAKAEAEGGAIAQIDQSTTISDVAIPVGVRTAGSTLVVRVGGDATFQEVVCTIPTTGSDNPYANSTRILGDVDASGTVDLSDVTPILYHAGGVTLLTGENLQAADVTDEGVADLSDVTPVLYYSAGISSVVDGKVTVADKANYVAEN